MTDLDRNFDPSLVLLGSMRAYTENTRRVNSDQIKMRKESHLNPHSMGRTNLKIPLLGGVPLSRRGECLYFLIFLLLILG
jgi:hypothetical protein